MRSFLQAEGMFTSQEEQESRVVGPSSLVGLYKENLFRRWFAVVHRRAEVKVLFRAAAEYRRALKNNSEPSWHLLDESICGGGEFRHSG